MALGFGPWRRVGSTSFWPGVPRPKLEEKGWALLLFDRPHVSKLGSYEWSDLILVETEVLWPVERGLLIITLGPFPRKPAIMLPCLKAGLPSSARTSPAYLTAVAWDGTGCPAPSPPVSSPLLLSLLSLCLFRASLWSPTWTGLGLILTAPFISCAQLIHLCQVSSSLWDNNHWQIGHYIYKVWDT